MTVTEERTKLEAPVETDHGVRPWLVAVIGVVALVAGLLLGVFLGDGTDFTKFEPTTVLVGDEIVAAEYKVAAVSPSGRGPSPSCPDRPAERSGTSAARTTVTGGVNGSRPQ